MWFDTMMYGVILSQFVKWCSHYGRSERKPTRYLVVRLSAHLERRELKGMVIVVADDSYYRILHLVCSYPPSPPWYGTDIEELSIMILMRHIFAAGPILPSWTPLGPACWSSSKSPSSYLLR